VWRYDSATHTISVEHGPAGAVGIATVSCYATLTCAIVDVGKSGPRFFTTQDGGTTWSSPESFGVLPTNSVTSMSCSSRLTCVTSFLNSPFGVNVEVTNDGGQTWVQRTSQSTTTWADLASLDCSGRTCVGLAKLPEGWRVMRTENLGKSWKKVAPVRGPLDTLACATLDRCVVGGTLSASFQSAAPYLATLSSGVVTAAKLKYVPTPIVDVACGSRLCAAIGVTTVMTLRP
jgi:hypothetical protein